MALFGKKNIKGKDISCCCKGGSSIKNTLESVKVEIRGIDVKVLGSGCTKCNKLKAATESALEQLGMDTAVDYVTDFAQMAAYGVLTTPALLVNGRIVSCGRVLKVDEIIKLLQEARG